MKTLNIKAGDSIYVAAEKAVELANKEGKCQFVFNDIQLIVKAGFHADQLVTEYCLRSYIRRLENKIYA
jgi:hypothetical protein